MSGYRLVCCYSAIILFPPNARQALTFLPVVLQWNMNRVNLGHHLSSELVRLVEEKSCISLVNGWRSLRPTGPGRCTMMPVLPTEYRLYCIIIGSYVSATDRARGDHGVKKSHPFLSDSYMYESRSRYVIVNTGAQLQRSIFMAIK